MLVGATDSGFVSAEFSRRPRDLLGREKKPLNFSSIGRRGVEFNFELVATPLGLSDVNISDTLQVSCPNGTDGGISFDIGYSDNFQFPADLLMLPLNAH